MENEYLKAAVQDNLEGTVNKRLNKMLECRDGQKQRKVGPSKGDLAR